MGADSGVAIIGEFTLDELIICDRIKEKRPYRRFGQNLFFFRNGIY